MKTRSRRYSESALKVDRNRLYSPYDGVVLVKESARSGFDETVDAAIRLGVDPRRADQMIRGTVMLPRGTGRQSTEYARCTPR